MRFDAFVARQAQLSRQAVRDMIDAGYAAVTGKRAKPSYSLKPGDEVSYESPEALSPIPEPENIPVNIVYEDSDIAVLDKPVGISVHPSKNGEGGTLVNALLYHVGELSLAAGIERPGVVHRLDKGTSGLLAVAKSDIAYYSLAKQFSERTAVRRYTALVHGNFANARGIIETPYGKDPSNRTKMAVLPAASRMAKTEYELEEQFAGYSLLRLSLYTGRTHQIRVHMAYIGHPVIGDEKYGLETELDKRFESQLLHAYRLEISHPATGEKMAFETGIPKRFSPLIPSETQSTDNTTN